MMPGYAQTDKSWNKSEVFKTASINSYINIFFFK